VKKAEYKIDEARAGALPQIKVSAILTTLFCKNLFLRILEGKMIRCFWNEMAICEFCKPLSEIFDQRVFIGLKLQNLQGVLSF
jgi:hypothetical protein